MTSFNHGSTTSSSLPPAECRTEVSAPVEHHNQVDPGRAHLMSIPRELRDKIYEYLLRVDGFAGLRDETHAEKLELPILRVNRTLHDEASRTLYIENPWVHISIEPWLLLAFCSWAVRGKKEFPGSRPISPGTSARIKAEAVATMTLQMLPHVDPTVNNIHLAVCLFAIPRFCRVLQSHLNMHSIDIAVFLNAKKVGGVKDARQKRLVNWLEETRGFGRAKISGGQGSQSLVKLGALMMSPPPSLQEYLNRASAYQTRALEKEQSGRLLEARYDYQDCYNLCTWTIGLDIEMHDDEDLLVASSIDSLMRAVSVSHAFLLIKLRDFNRALDDLNWTLKYRLKKEKKDRFNVETAFACGLRDLAIGADSGAAYCFLHVLWEQPGHHGADNAVDEIESRLTYRTDWTALITLYNIKHFLQPFRHQEHGSAVMDKAAYEALVKQWLTCVDEVDSIGYRTRWRFSMGYDPKWIKRMYNYASAILYEY